MDSVKEKINLVGNLDLLNSLDYQFLYASQNYGTFYGIYGKFDAQRIKKNKYQINSITFLLINYKGVINIGFNKGCNVKVTYDNSNTPQIQIDNCNVLSQTDGDVFSRETDGDEKFKIYLRGLSSNNYLKLDFPKGQEIILNGEYFYMIRIIKTLNIKRSNDNEADPYENEIFDSEYFYRDGLKKPKEKRYRYGKEKIKNDKNEEHILGSNLINDDCVETRLKIIDN